ncbi:MAG: phage major capsid protein, partial [Acidobacteriota bacterium]
MGNPDVITEIKGLFRDFSEKHDQLFRQVEKQEAEIKRFGETQPSTAKSIDEIVEGMDQIRADLKGVRNTADDVQSRLDEAEKKGKRPGFGGAEQRKTAAEIFYEHDQVKRLNGLGNTDEIIVGESWSEMRGRGQKSTLMTTVAPEFVQPQVLPDLYPVRRKLRIRDLFANVPIDVNAFEYFEMTGFAASGAADGVVTHGAAAMVSEGQAYPEAQMRFTKRKGNVEKVGHYLPVTDEMLADRPGMESMINNQLSYGVDYRIDHQILYGNGLSPQLPG